MHLTASEIDILRATLGIRAARLFCPAPSIWNTHLEASSYTIWLDSAPDFLNIFAVEQAQYDFRIAVERSANPRDFQYDSQTCSVKDCSDIFLETKDPSTIRQIGIYQRNGTDWALLFEFDKGGSFGITAGVVPDEVCFFWNSDWGRTKETLTLRSVIE